MKIIHITDLHFGYHFQPILDDFLDDVSAVDPDIILISGDLTQRATSEQFIQALAFLKQLSAEIVIVPGNHDIPIHKFVVRFLQPFKRYRKYIASTYKDHYEHADVKILGLNSVNKYRIKKGRLALRDFNTMKSFFNEDYKGINMLFFHHNFLRFNDFHKPLENAQQLVSYLNTSNIHIVCTGHLHYANVGIFQKKDKGAGIILHGGSLCCQRNKDLLHSYFLLQLENSTCDLQWRVHKNANFHVSKSCMLDFTQPYEETKKIIEKTFT